MLENLERNIKMAKDVISGECGVGTLDFTSVASASAYYEQDVWLGADIIYSVDAGVGLGHTVIDYLAKGGGRKFLGVFRETRRGVAEFVSMLQDAAASSESSVEEEGAVRPVILIEASVTSAETGHPLLAGVDLRGGVYDGRGYVLVAAHQRVSDPSDLRA